MPVSKFTLKYFNKMISNVYSLSKYSPKAILGQVPPGTGNKEVEQTESLPTFQKLGMGWGGGDKGTRRHRARPPGAIEAVFVQAPNERVNEWRRGWVAMKKKVRCLAVAELGLKPCGELQGHKGRTD